jgi:hypothetical protein
MESYDEFANRARIITEVHALPPQNSIGKPDCVGTDLLSLPCSPEKNASKKKVKDAMKKSLKRL